MSFKLKLAMALFVVLGAVSFVHGKSFAYSGYFGSNITSAAWCNVLGAPNSGRTSSNCVDPNGRSYQDYALQSLNPQTTACAATDSNCLKAAIESEIQTKLAAGGNDYLEHTGAAYIIESMVGTPWGRGDRNIYAGGANGNIVTDWLSRINNPAVTLRINGSYSYGPNTAFDQSTNDVLQYSDSGTAPVLEFWYNGQLEYVIKLDCGNPLGNFPGLPAYVPIQLSCGAMINPPNKPELGDRISVTVTVTYSNGPPQGRPSGQITVSNGVGNVGVQSINSSGGSSGTFTMVSNTFPVNTLGTYVVSWSLSVDGQPPVSCGGDISLSGDTFDVFNYPYFNAMAGDIAAGSRFASNVGDVGCTNDSSNTSAGIVGWNKGAPTYNGASGQYGLSAPNYIQEIISSKGNNNGGVMSTLSFGNVGTGTPNSITTPGLYGGFNTKGPCVDYWAYKPLSANPIANVATIDLSNPRSISSGVYVVSGTNAKLTIHDAGGVPNGTHVTIYVDGDVSINTDIKDASTTWLTPNDIPSFKLVAKGRIFIDSSVSELDGNFIAVPDTGYESTANRNSYASPMKGTISTCSLGFAVVAPTVSPVQPMLNTCNNPLAFYGTVAAYQIFLLRTYGSMSHTGPTEQFNLSPEVWLAPDTNSTVDPAYKSIVGLPPVL